MKLKVLFLSFALSLPAGATPHEGLLSATHLPGWRTEHGTYMTALRLDLAPGWKTYWRSPGDTGIPPVFNWSGSQNLAGVKVHWPRPHAFVVNGYRAIGYDRQLVLPLELTPADPAQPIGVSAEVDLGICSDICVPATLSFQSHLSGPGAPDEAIRAALAAQPASGAEAGLAAIGCTVEPIDDGLRLTARLALPPTGGQEAVVFEPGPAPIWVSEAEVSRSGRTLVATADLVSNDGGPVMLDRSAMTVTVLGDHTAVEISGCPAP